MLKIKLIGDIDIFKPGIQAMKEDLSLCFCDDGIPVTVEKGDKLSVRMSEEEGHIIYGEKVHFFRALSYIEQYGTLCFVEEKSCFKKSGIMFDSSRNAVIKPETLKFMFRKMALMGLNMGMMYTEDTYEVENYPYFGYLRGAYSKAEIKDLDDYADMLGIELVPCIQTLAHLECVLRWEAMAPIRDTARVMEIDNEETYKFIAQIIKDASEPYRTKRIHIGMDEAELLGLGKYLKDNGYVPAHDLMLKHLSRVNEIVKAQGLEPMIWSDMFFSSCSPDDNYYDLVAPIPEHVIESVPDNVTLVYWHYGTVDEETDDIMLKRHKLFKAKTTFAGGLSTWSGMTPGYGSAIYSAKLALRQCFKHGIDEAIATAWGDNGQECNLITALYGFQVWAEMGYHEGIFHEEYTKNRFKACVGVSADAFLDISRLDEVDGVVPPPNFYVADPTKYMLFEDPLFETMGDDSQHFKLSPYYKKMTTVMEKHRDENPEFKKMFEFFVRLSAAVEKKCIWHENAAKCVREKDRVTAQMLSELAPEIIAKIQELSLAWEDFWMDTNKPYGFDAIEVRLGGVMARMETAGRHMKDFADGLIDTIPGLDEEKIPYKSYYPMGHLNCYKFWHEIITNGYAGIRETF